MLIICFECCVYAFHDCVCSPTHHDLIIIIPYFFFSTVVFSEVKNDDASILSPNTTYRPGSGDSVSSLGHDDYYPENTLPPDVCNIQNLARNVIREAALLFLECDSQCNDQPLHVPRRAKN